MSFPEESLIEPLWFHPPFLLDFHFLVFQTVDRSDGHGSAAFKENWRRVAQSRIHVLFILCPLNILV